MAQQGQGRPQAQRNQQIPPPPVAMALERLPAMSLIEQTKDRWAYMLADSGLKPETVIADLKRQMTLQVELQNCTPDSLMRAVFMAAKYRCSFGPEGIWLIPRKNWKLNNALEANAQLSYRYKVQRGKEFGLNNMRVFHVLAGDKYTTGGLPEAVLSHTRDRTQPWEWSRLLFCYVLFNDPDGVQQQWIVDRDEIEYRKQKTASRCYVDGKPKGFKVGDIVGPWVDDEKGMVEKTCLTYVCDKSIPDLTAFESEAPLLVNGPVLEGDFTEVAPKPVLDTKDFAGAGAPTPAATEMPSREGQETGGAAPSEQSQKLAEQADTAGKVDPAPPPAEMMIAPAPEKMPESIRDMLTPKDGGVVWEVYGAMCAAYVELPQNPMALAELRKAQGPEWGKKASEEQLGALATLKSTFYEMAAANGYPQEVKK